jgi:sarcosine/dimethylglycine N-methyltransferase
MKTSGIDAQYETGLSRQSIERALIAAGKDPGRLMPADLGMLEDFHTMGRIATGQLAELAGVTGQDHVLDAGTGIGGTARFLASQYGCRVTGIDLTAEYCETAAWLNTITGLGQKIDVRQGDVTGLPFADAGFDVVISQHVQMNVADKVRLYAEARRVLAGGGRLAIWDVTAGAPGQLGYPLPWADQPDRSYLVSAEELRAVIEAAGFAIDHWADLTGQAVDLMRAVLSSPPAPLGLHAFVPGFAVKAQNLTEGLASGRLRVIQAVALAVLRAGLGHGAVDLGVHAHVVERSGQDRRHVGASRGAAADIAVEVAALSGGDGADDQPDDQNQSGDVMHADPVRPEAALTSEDTRAGRAGPVWPGPRFR